MNFIRALVIITCITAMTSNLTSEDILSSIPETIFQPLEVISTEFTTSAQQRFSPDAKLVKKSEKDLKIAVLLYHEFSEGPAGNDPYNLFTTTEVLEENIRTLQESRYSFIDFNDLYAFFYDDKPLPEKSVLITCDDGYSSNYTLAYPIFKKYNVKAAIFVVDSLVGTTDYFTWEQAKEMDESGIIDIYSHGKNHIDHTKMSIETLQKEVVTAHQNIEQNLGKEKRRIFAYPSGFNSQETRDNLKESGFEIQVITNYGRAFSTQDADLTRINRIRCCNQLSGTQIIKTMEE